VAYFLPHLRRKYYDDCAQILSEHILALLKPTALKTLSTLDPLVTTNTNHLVDDDTVDEPPPRKAETFLSRASRILQGEPTDDDDRDEVDSRQGTSGSIKAMDNNNNSNAGGGSPNRSEAGDMYSTAAATLDEGALPVREFPSNLTSEPPSMGQSTNSSVSEEKLLERKWRSYWREPHQEELRCVVAIIRHGDRTPKQKLKVNMSEPHILQYFHDQYVNYMRSTFLIQSC